MSRYQTPVAAGIAFATFGVWGLVAGLRIAGLFERDAFLGTLQETRREELREDETA